MKKILFLVCMLLAGYGLRLNAQSPYCLAAGYLSPTSTPTQKSIDSTMQLSAAEKWFKVLGGSDSSYFRLTTFIAGHRYRIDKIEVYKGASCASLTFLGKDSLESSSDSILQLPVGNHTATDTLYIRTTYITNSLCPSCSNTNLNFRLQMWYLTSVQTACTTCTTMTGCNLVCNGNFETHGTMSGGSMNITEACGWSNLTFGTCDYFNTGAPAGATGVHCNMFGDQNPNTLPGTGGNGYAGFASRDPINQNYAEFMKTKLLQPLVQGATYTVSCYVSLGEYSTSRNNQLGVYFYDGNLPAGVSTSTVHISVPLPYPVYSLNTSGVTTSGWTPLTFTFQPGSTGLQWMAIGGFSNTYTSVPCSLGIGPCSVYGCSPNQEAYMYIDDISVIGPVSTTTYTVSGCAGSSHTLTSTLNGPWSWSGPGGVTATTQSITTTYGTQWPSNPFVVTGTTSGCMAEEKFFVSGVYPDVNITVSPGPATPACAGQPIVFTASGLSVPTYTWYTTHFDYWVLPPIVSPAGTGATFTYTPTSSPATQILYAYGTAPNGCGDIGSVVINIISPPSAVITGDLSMCVQTDHIETYTAAPQSAGVAYTWSVTCNGVSIPFTPAPDGQSITVDWTAYAGGVINGQVCLTVSAPGCSSSNACLQVAPCCAPSGYTVFPGNTDPNNPTHITTSFAAGSSYALSGYYVIDGVISWSNIRFAMAPGTKITIPAATPSNNKLILTECHFFGCSKMWDGIYVDGGLLQTNSNKKNLFEDAVNAIVLLNGTNPGPLTSLYFNKCHIGIDFRTSASANSTVIARCVFTSRDFGINTAGTNLTSTYLSTTPGPSSIPYNYPDLNYMHYPSANMLVPYAGFRGHIGVNVADNTQVTVGYTNTLTTDRNIFDNLFYGIIGTNSNVYVFNNLFIYIQEHCNLATGGCREPASITCPAGTAICTANTNSTQTSTPKFTKVGVGTGSNPPLYPNYFESDQYGVYNTVNRSLDARGNDFKIIDKVGIYTDLGSNYYSNFPTSYPANVMNILNNTMSQAQTGIQLKDNRNAIMIVNNNKFNWTNWSTTTTQQSVSGIIVENAVVHTYGSLFVNDNQIANLQKGITLTLQGYNGTGTTARAQVFRNQIKFNQWGGSGVSVQHYGVGLFSCKRVTVEGNNDVNGDVYRTITSPSTPALLNTQSQRDLFSGLRIESSTETWVTDMNIIQTPGGIYVKNACTSSNFWCNTLTSTFNGFFLDNAAISDQLNLPSYNHSPTGNQWISNVAGKVSGSSPSPGITWFYNNTAGTNYNPLPVIGSISGIGFSSLYEGPSDPCSFQLNPEEPPIDPQMRVAGAGPKVYEPNTTGTKQFESQTNTESGNTNQREVEGIPSLEMYPTYLDSMGVQAAAIYNADIATSSNDEAARKQVDEIHLRSWAQGITGFSGADSTYLCWLAAQNPDSLGSAVYSALVMVGDCNENEEQSLRDIAIHETTPLIDSKSYIYPNPNDGKMQANISLTESEKGTLEIFDLAGIRLSGYSLVSGANQFVIDETRLSAGVYVYRIKINGVTKDTRRLVIVK